MNIGATASGGSLKGCPPSLAQPFLAISERSGEIEVLPAVGGDGGGSLMQ